MPYNNYDRKIAVDKARSSTSINPRSIAEDMQESIHVLNPQSQPLQSLFRFIGRGKAPQGEKVWMVQSHSFSSLDFVSDVLLGSTIPGWQQYARITIDQISRPGTKDIMYYQPQEKFFIEKTKQNVEVIATPTNSIKINGTPMILPVGLTGNTTTTTLPGTLVVKCTDPSLPILPFTSSDVVYMGYTIHEGQKIESQGHETDVLYDFNYVERKEKTFAMTDDQRDLIKTKFKMPDWDFQQQQMLQAFTESNEMMLYLGQRGIDMSNPGEPRRWMQGLYNAIQTNVLVYNPDNVSDWETFMANSMEDVAFAYNPNGYKKIAIAGPSFIKNFNLYFATKRQMNNELIKGPIGLNIEKYIFGNYELSLIRNDAFGRNTQMSNWCFIIDPAEAVARIAKDYVSRHYELADERVYKFMTEWQGTVEWNLEQAHALIRTA